MAKWQTMWSCRDSQEVGLEAATLERVRNSSLVERDCADNVTGLKPCTEAWDCRKTLVGERSDSGEGGSTRIVGAVRSENAGMSSEKHVRTMFANNLRFPTEGQSASG
jgi:hypothetical protein